MPKTEAGHILDRIEKGLAKSPEKNPDLKGEFAGLRRLRIGDYRFISAMVDAEVIILRIARRRDVYRQGA